MRVTCTVVSLFWYYRYYLLMPQLTMHSLGIGATVSPETFSHVRAIPPRRVTTPTKLIATTGPTVHSYYVTKPNGGKLNTAGITRHRFDRPLTVMADGASIDFRRKSVRARKHKRPPHELMPYSKHHQTRARPLGSTSGGAHG